MQHSIDAAGGTSLGLSSVIAYSHVGRQQVQLVDPIAMNSLNQKLPTVSGTC